MASGCSNVRQISCQCFLDPQPTDQPVREKEPLNLWPTICYNTLLNNVSMLLLHLKINCHLFERTGVEHQMSAAYHPQTILFYHVNIFNGKTLHTTIWMLMMAGTII